EKLLFVTRPHALGRVDEGLQLGEPEGDGVGVARQRVVTTSSREKLLPGEPSLAPSLELLGPAERAEDAELTRGRRDPPLLEPTDPRNEPPARPGDPPPRARTPPGVRPRPPVPEDARGENEPRLALGAQFGERGDLVLVEEAVGH